MGKGHWCSRSLNTVAHTDVSLPPLNFTVSVMVAAALSLLCLVLLLYLYMNEANVTRPNQPVGIQMRFIAFPVQIVPVMSGIFGFSDLLMTSSPYSSLLYTLMFASQKPLRGSASLLSPLLLSWCSQIHKILWFQRSLQLLQCHCVPRRSSEVTSPRNPESVFILLAPKPYSVGLKSYRVELKTLSLPSISITPLS